MRMYGQDLFVDGALEEIVELAETLGMRLRGKEVPIKLKKRRNPR